MKTIAKGIASIVLFAPILSYAGWPIFSVPSPEQVKAQLISEGCPAGEGHIPTGTKFPFKSFNQTWYWEYSGNSICRKVPSQLNYVSYEQTGSYSGDKITTGYGSANNVLFRFTFTIPYCNWDSECKWYCVPISNDKPPTLLSCAYDQLQHVRRDA